MLIQVDEEICLDQNLQVDPLNIGVGVVMGDQIFNSLDHILREMELLEHNFCLAGAELLLEPAVRRVIQLLRLFDADVVRVGCRLQNEHGLLVQLFLSADIGGVAVYLCEVLDALGLPLVHLDHLQKYVVQILSCHITVPFGNRLPKFLKKKRNRRLAV